MKDCSRQYHGNYFEESGLCVYYVQARKICLVIDQDNNYALDEKYEEFKCDTFSSLPKGYVKYQFMRWGLQVEPTNRDYFYYDLNIEVYLKKDPYTMVNMYMDFASFDIQSVSYILTFNFPFLES